jgi:hypothetical protein
MGRGKKQKVVTCACQLYILHVYTIDKLVLLMKGRLEMVTKMYATHNSIVLIIHDIAGTREHEVKKLAEGRF